MSVKTKEVETISDLITSKAETSLTKLISEGTKFIEGGQMTGGSYSNGGYFVTPPNFFFVPLNSTEFTNLQKDTTTNTPEVPQGYKRCTATVTVYLSEEDNSIYLQKHRDTIVNMIENDFYEHNVTGYIQAKHAEFLQTIESLEYFKNNPEAEY